MPAVEASPVASSESGFVKMEDRKRAATSDHNDSAPPLKKQATSVNGGGKPHPDADMPWKDDLEVSSGLAGVVGFILSQGGLGNPSSTEPTTSLVTVFKTNSFSQP